MPAACADGTIQRGSMSHSSSCSSTRRRTASPATTQPSMLAGAASNLDTDNPAAVMSALSKIAPVLLALLAVWVFLSGVISAAIYRAWGLLLLALPHAAAVAWLWPMSADLRHAVLAGLLAVAPRSFVKLAQERRRAAGAAHGQRPRARLVDVPHQRQHHHAQQQRDDRDGRHQPPGRARPQVVVGHLARHLAVVLPSLRKRLDFARNELGHLIAQQGVLGGGVNVVKGVGHAVLS